MKTKITARSVFSVLMAGAIVVSSCKKEDSSITTTSSTDAIAVVASASIASSDSVYLVNGCNRGEHRDSVSAAALPAAINTYLGINYPNYVFHKAFVLTNSSSVTTGYLVVIYFNDKPVGLKFDAAGAFVKVLEQRERGDLSGPGWHHGGRFEHRDGQQKDTVALSALPVSVTTYLAANYPTDTLLKAFKNRDSSLVVLSRNNGLYATVFDASGNFVRRVQMPAKNGNCQGIDQSALPSQVTNYLSATYPNYIFKKAFIVNSAGVTQGYVVLIDANNTKYAVAFDASGNFLSAKTIF
jgi:hypothetical protein